MLMPTQRRTLQYSETIGSMLASITNESNMELTFQIFSIRIVVTAPGIVRSNARRFGGRNWIGRLRILRGFLQWSTRHGKTSG